MEERLILMRKSRHSAEPLGKESVYRAMSAGYIQMLWGEGDPCNLSNSIPVPWKEDKKRVCVRIIFRFSQVLEINACLQKNYWGNKLINFPHRARILSIMHGVSYSRAVSLAGCLLCSQRSLPGEPHCRHSWPQMPYRQRFTQLCQHYSGSHFSCVPHFLFPLLWFCLCTSQTYCLHYARTECIRF